MNEFSVHRIIGRGGFGEVYGCRKSDTGKMYAMKCLDKKRIKLKGGESLALNERIMLSLVSSGKDGCPFIVCMTYAFHTPEKLCFLLDLMNGGDLHYHLSQHNVFSEKEVQFYSLEVLLGLEHMHTRYVVYRDLKPANCLLDVNGHVRISDLGLACDFSKKRPSAGVGTHGYMAPEVLTKGISYDSSADWFSFGCMIYKLLRGYSPFRQHRAKEKADHEKLSFSLNLEFTDAMSQSICSLIEGLLNKDVENRLGCKGRGASEIKEHPFFVDVDWKQGYLRKYPPPIIPPRGEVNAADAFDIGSFDEEDVKGVKLSEQDQSIYSDFNLTVSDRWQAEICETVFDVINQEADKIESKRKHKQHAGNSGGINFSSAGNVDDEVNIFGSIATTDCIVEGELSKLGGPFNQTWQKKHVKLFPNRIEMYNKSRDGSVSKGVELVSMLDMKEISIDFVKMNKADNCIMLIMKNDMRVHFTSTDRIVINQWKEELEKAYATSQSLISRQNRKAHKMYGADDLLDHHSNLHHGPVTSSSTTGNQAANTTINQLSRQLSTSLDHNKL